MAVPFIPKENQELPDSYRIEVLYVNGKKEEFDLASHFYNKDTGIFEFWTIDDLCNWIPATSIQRMQFSKEFSKIVAIRRKQEEDNAVKNT